MLVINKTDLAPHAGASPEVMEANTRRMRGSKPYAMTNLLLTQAGLADMVAFLEERGLLRPT